MPNIIERISGLLEKVTAAPWFCESKPHREAEQCQAIVTSQEEDTAFTLFDSFNRGYKVSGIERDDNDEDGKFHDIRGLADLELVTELRNAASALMDALAAAKEMIAKCGACGGDGYPDGSCSKCGPLRSKLAVLEEL